MKQGTTQLRKCPECKSKDLNYEDIDSTKDGLKQEVECNKCGTTFTEFFKFVRWELSQ